jgi:glycosyltransferase involved in cell wall biosynthesis
LGQIINLNELYIDSDTGPGQIIEWAEYDMVIASPLSTGISIIPVETHASIIGICMAYEINEEAKSLEGFQEVRRNISRCSAIVCDSEYIRKKIIDNYSFRGEIIRIAYGCDKQRFEEIEFQDRGILRIVSTRNWTKIHSNQTTLGALELAYKFIASFYGSGDELTNKTKESASALMPNQVSFHGAYTQENLPKILENSEVFVSASISDGCSVSLLEAMTAGRICICRDFPTNRELIKNGENGFLFSSEAQLMDLLIKVNNLKFEEKERISKAAKASVSEIANWSKNSLELQNLANRWLRK